MDIEQQASWYFDYYYYNEEGGKGERDKGANNTIRELFQWDFSQEGETNLNKREMSFSWNDYELSFGRCNIFYFQGSLYNFHKNQMY